MLLDRAAKWRCDPESSLRSASRSARDALLARDGLEVAPLAVAFHCGECETRPKRAVDLDQPLGLAPELSYSNSRASLSARNLAAAESFIPQD
jgi:hypothetical protein